MFKQTGTHLLNCNKEEVTSWLNSFDTVITDCDGVLWIYSNVIRGSKDAINTLREMGKNIYFCTNNSTKTRRHILNKSHLMGFQIEEEQIISTAHSTAAYLKNTGFQKKAFVIGMEGITLELEMAGIQHTPIGPDHMVENLSHYLEKCFSLDEDVGAVIVGFDEHFSFPKLTKAASYLSDPDCLFIATNTDERFPMPNYVIPGTGSMVTAVERCTDRKATVIGKPNVGICDWLIRDNCIIPERTLMIGDRCNTDILLGYNCGFQTLLVGTGIQKDTDIEAYKASNDPEQKKMIPDTYLPCLGDILKLLEKTKDK